ncbi:MAG: hypothetical protein ABSC42_02650 [Tepidisphaeraceae bacterium]
MTAHGQTNRQSGIQCCPNSQAGLPPGVRQADCDGQQDPFADASGNQLWNACNLAQQESLSSRFVTRHGDLVRDALLDVQDSPNPNPGPKLRLGSLLWPTWICFRDRNLREMHQRGELPGT